MTIIIMSIKKNIMVWFGIPEVVVTNNMTQLANKGFWQLMVDLGIKHRYTSVEHLQTNYQGETANKVIFAWLR